MGQNSSVKQEKRQTMSKTTWSRITTLYNQNILRVDGFLYINVSTFLLFHLTFVACKINKQHLTQLEPKLNPDLWY